jgi:hypothetical protein
VIPPLFCMQCESASRTGMWPSFCWVPFRVGLTTLMTMISQNHVRK